MLRPPFVLGVSLLALLSSASTALAHGGHDPRLKIAANETEIRIETSLSVKSFLEFDVDKDGRLSVSEFESQYNVIAAWVDMRLQLHDTSGRVLKPYFSDSPIIDRAHLDKHDAIDNIRILRRYKLVKKLDALTLTVNLFDHDPQVLFSISGMFLSLPAFTLCLDSHLKGEIRTCRSL